MYEYVCEYCGKIKYAKYKSWCKRFCSYECSTKFSWSQKEKKREKFHCEVCGKEFLVKSSDYRIKKGSIKYCSKKCMGIANKKGTIVKCMQCGVEFYSTRRKFCSKKCASDYRSEHTVKKNYNENGYIVIHKRGYNKKGNAKQHRLIMEEFLGRKLAKNEIVHHKNGNKTDNRIENLQVMTRSEHSKLHRMLEIKQGKKLFKGTELK